MMSVSIDTVSCTSSSTSMNQLPNTCTMEKHIASLSAAFPMARRPNSRGNDSSSPDRRWLGTSEKLEAGQIESSLSNLPTSESLLPHYRFLQILCISV